VGLRAAFLAAGPRPIFSSDFTGQVKEPGIQEVLGAPPAPRRRAYIERLIGTIRRECLDHVMVFNEASLSRHLKVFLEYYHERERICRCRRTSRRVVLVAAAGVGACGNGAAGWPFASSVRTSSRVRGQGTALRDLF
jgi:hypothetical protein